MSEHKTNPMVKAMEQVNARKLATGLHIGFFCKANVLVMAPDRIRAREDGTLEVFAVPPVQQPDGSWSPGGGEPSWQTPPPGTSVIPEGTRLPVDAMDVCVVLVANMVGGMLSPDGRVMGRQRNLRELFREDAQTFLASFGTGAPS